MINEARPHGVILDIGLPKLDGFGVLKELRQDHRPMPPILMLTARSGQDDVRVALALGARDYLTKPFDDARLLARVARLLHKRTPPKPGPDELNLDAF